MVAEQDFDRRLARLYDFLGFGEEDLAFGDGRGASGLQLGHFFLADYAHPAGAAQREAGIVAKRGNLDARGLAGLDEQGSRRCGELFAVYCETYVRHEMFPLACSGEFTSFLHGWYFDLQPL